MSDDVEKNGSHDSESEDENKSITAVDLGFLDANPDDDAFTPQVFPSKIGGKPVWLDPRTVIGGDVVSCGVCSGPLVLLAQLYAPIPKREHDAYHRTLYVFVCPKGACCIRNSNKNFIVFRSQLPEENPIYPSGNSSADEMDSAIERVYKTTIPQLCAVCGIQAPFRCARCKAVSYCCRTHQTQHWQSGGHKSLCADLKDSDKETKEVKSAGNIATLTLPEFELFIEPEPAQENGDDDNVTDAPNDLESFSKEQTEFEESDKNLEAQINPKSKKDPTFKRFLRRVKRRPAQVVRYELSTTSSPLWPTYTNQPENIPNCGLCGSKRQFEFQIMPQLLNHLRLDDESIIGDNGIDWATLAIYTCSANCPTATAEKVPCCAKEFLWKQDYTE